MSLRDIFRVPRDLDVHPIMLVPLPRHQWIIASLICIGLLRNMVVDDINSPQRLSGMGINLNHYLGINGSLVKEVSFLSPQIRMCIKIFLVSVSHINNGSLHNLFESL